MKKSKAAKSRVTDFELSTDTAISSSSEDLLERSLFASSLADTIVASSTDHSLVVAINGGWGTGKSSIKNMVIERLRQSDTAEIVEFNPWDFSGEKELAAGFFHDLGLALGIHEPGKASAERVATWNAIATRLSGGGSAIKAIGKVLGMAGVPMAEVVGTALGGALKESGDLSRQAKDALGEQRKLEKKTLSELKQQLRENLPKSSKPLVVIVDDIDRLTSDEVCLLFRLVKANADFPRVVFVLLFDRPQVVRALAQIATGHGDAFLEKIVQVSFDVPDLAPEQVAEFAQEEFNRILKRIRLRLDKADAKRWETIYSECLMPYFLTLRSVRRFTNSLRFHFSLYRTKGGFEVNAVDLAALEVLRVFENDLYRQLPRYRTLLLREGPYLMGIDELKKMAQDRWPTLLKHVPEERRESVDELLRRLFPNVATGDGIEIDPVRLVSRRVAHPRMFDTYFRLSLPRNAISQAELTRIKRAAANYSQFRGFISKYMARGRFDRLFEHLWEYIDDLAPHAAVVTQVLLDVSDVRPVRLGSWLHDSEAYLLTNFIQAIITKDRNVEERGDILINAISKAKGLDLAFRLVSGETTYRKDKAADLALIAESRLPKLKSVLADRVSTLKDTALLSRPDTMPWKLRLWHECIGNEEPARWLRTQLSPTDNLIRTLEAFSDNSRSIDDTTRLRVDLLGRFITPVDLKEIVTQAAAKAQDSNQAAFLAKCAEEIRSFQEKAQS